MFGRSVAYAAAGSISLLFCTGAHAAMLRGQDRLALFQVSAASTPDASSTGWVARVSAVGLDGQSAVQWSWSARGPFVIELPPTAWQTTPLLGPLRLSPAAAGSQLLQGQLSPVPVPPAVWMFMSGAGLLAISRRRRPGAAALSDRGLLL
jgi:hypothetical protein